MHGSDAAQGEEVVHVGEHTLLHLTAVPGVQDYLHLLGEVEYYCSLGVQTELLVVLYLGLGGIEDNEVRLAVTCQLLVGGADEHVLYEMCLPCHLHDEADLLTGILVGTAECVHPWKRGP